VAALVVAVFATQLRAQTITYNFTPAPPYHAPASDDHFGYFYDANGNLIAASGSSETIEYTYTPFNKLKTVKKNGAPVASYLYNADGKRIAKIDEVTGEVSERYFGPLEKKLGLMTSYYFIGGKRIAKRRNDGLLTFFQQDHLGSTSVLTDSNGNPTLNRKYYEFGAIKSESGSDDESYAYNDKRRDKDTNFYDYEARSYAAKSFRFIQPDTVVPDASNPQDWNRYAYVTNNPLRYIDPTGHFRLDKDKVYSAVASGIDGGISKLAISCWRGTGCTYGIWLQGVGEGLVAGTIEREGERRGIDPWVTNVVVDLALTPFRNYEKREPFFRVFQFTAPHSAQSVQIVLDFRKDERFFEAHMNVLRAALATVAVVKAARSGHYDGDASWRMGDPVFRKELFNKPASVLTSVTTLPFGSDRSFYAEKRHQYDERSKLNSYPNFKTFGGEGGGKQIFKGGSLVKGRGSLNFGVTLYWAVFPTLLNHSSTTIPSLLRPTGKEYIDHWSKLFWRHHSPN